MFAIIAAVIFGLGLLFELVGARLGNISVTEMTTAGLLFLALHFVTGRGWRGRGYRR